MDILEFDNGNCMLCGKKKNCAGMGRDVIGKGFFTVMSSKYNG
jgi:hypothetical protein